MNFFSVLETPELSDKDYICFDFYKDGKKLSGSPVCGMSLRKAGSMRFRWNETNDNRTAFLSKFNRKIVPVELIHSKIVFDVKNPEDTDGLQGDGIITANKELMPVITVADCMPVYLYDSVTGVFGVVHSGWKGTGICVEAIKLACEKYNSKPENFSVILGPHIHSCCYIVNEERADYFNTNFAKDCAVPMKADEQLKVPLNWDNGDGTLYRLSLEKANIFALLNAGVKSENINVCTDCTCCNSVFGSNRRETAGGSIFTVQAAFILEQPVLG